MADETISGTHGTPIGASPANAPLGAPVAGTVLGSHVAGVPDTMDTDTPTIGTMARVKEEASRGRDHALAAASTYADQGKDKAAGALTTLSGLIVEAAKLLEENFGHKAADPVRAQADRVSGAARHLEISDVDQLTTELKAFAKQNPILSVGAVAVVGFALGKLLTGGGRDD